MNTNVCLNHLEDCPSAEDWALQWLCSSGGLSIIVIAAMTCGIHRLCRREREVLADQPTYSVAISNSLFKEERWDLKGLKGLKAEGLLMFRGREEMPCLNCRLIEMGEMACYADTCPQCHRAPPGQAAREQGGGGGSRSHSRRGQLYINPADQCSELAV